MSEPAGTRAARQPVGRPREEALIGRLEAGKHASAMVDKPSLLARFVAKRIYANVQFPRRGADTIRDAASRSAVVYIIQTRSLADYLYFHYAFHQHGLPLARFANGVRTVFVRPLLRILAFFLAALVGLVRRRFPSKLETFEAAVSAGESALVFLERPAHDGLRPSGMGLPYLRSLVDIAQETEGYHPISLVPLVLVWEKRSESYHRSLFDEVFGPRQSPGALRKLIQLIQSVWQSALRFSTPHVQVSGAIDLDAFVRENELLNRREKAELLYDQLLAVCRRERRVIIGPPIKPPALIRQEILESERVDRIIADITRTELRYPSEVKREARKIVREIAAEFNLMMIKFLSAVMNPVFRSLYEGFDIDAEGLERVRAVARDHKMVIVPSHKSHMDYLLVSNVFYQHGMMPPHIVAGVNLSFFPLGFIFRRAGAFFVRRSFKGDRLYATLFDEYLTKLLNEGFPVEFFIEGTRSRTGRLSRPRYGILSMILGAVAEERLEKVAVVPVSVGYEKIVEGGAYEKESMGGEKRSENLSGVIQATKTLWSRYGRVYVEFEEPIFLEEAKREMGLGPDTPKADFELATRRIAYQIIHRINLATTVTPSAILATVLLSWPEKRSSQAELLKRAGFIVNYLRSKGARLSKSIQSAIDAPAPKTELFSSVDEETRPRKSDDGRKRRVESPPSPPEESGPDLGRDETAAEPLAGEDVAEGAAASPSDVGRVLRQTILKAINLFRDNKYVSLETDGWRVSYHVEDSRRPRLNYYRNNIVHFFVRDAFLAASLAVCRHPVVPFDELLQAARRLTHLLKLEFCYEPGRRVAANLGDAIDAFVDRGWLQRPEAGGPVLRPDETPAEVVFLRRQLHSVLESYWVVASCLELLVDEPIAQRDFLKRCVKRAGQLVSDDRIFLESQSKPTFQNAIGLLRRRGVLVPVEVEPAPRKAYEEVITLSPEHRENGGQAILDEVARYLFAPDHPIRADAGSGAFEPFQEAESADAAG